MIRSTVWSPTCQINNFQWCGFASCLAVRPPFQRVSLSVSITKNRKCSDVISPQLQLLTCITWIVNIYHMSISCGWHFGQWASSYRCHWEKTQLRPMTLTMSALSACFSSALNVTEHCAQWTLYGLLRGCVKGCYCRTRALFPRDNNNNQHRLTRIKPPSLLVFHIQHGRSAGAKVLMCYKNFA